MDILKVYFEYYTNKFGKNIAINSPLKLFKIFGAISDFIDVFVFLLYIRTLE